MLTLPSRLLGISSILLLSTLSACGGGSSSDNPAPEVVNITTTTEELASLTAVYTDSRISFRYPENWVLMQSNPQVTAQILAPETNEAGGMDNCTIGDENAANRSLVEVVDDTLTAVYIDEPSPPETSFLTLNSEPTARVVGFTAILNFRVPIITQIFVKDETAQYISCLGDSDKFISILNTVTHITN